MKVFVSNQLPILAEKLFDHLFRHVGSPLGKRYLIVPSEEIKNDLYLRWTQKINIVTAIQTMAYSELQRKVFPEIPSKLELALRLEAILDTSPSLSTYLKGGEHLRKLDLCDELSTLFLKYLRRPTEELWKWAQQEGWQQELWRGVFGNQLPTETVKLLPGSLFFYHIPHIASYEWKAFSQMDSSWFLFSPTEMFWGDFKTDWQQSRLLKKLGKTAQEDLARYFKQDSPLLSNWGKQGRELLRFFEDIDTIELFQPSQGNSALHQLQKGWLTLESQKSEPDASIQLHSAPTLFREVEVVWEIIQRLPFSPREILVMAPNIQDYAAAIEWVFEERGGPFDYSITGLEARRNSHLLQGLEILLSLPKHRFSKKIFEKLLLCPPFLKRFNLSLEDAETISRWMSEVYLRYDLHTHPGSWHESLKRILNSLTLSTTGLSFDFSDAPLISRWIEIALYLQAALTPLSDQKERTGEEWADLIEQWLQIFFISEEEVDTLSSTIATLRSDKVQGMFPYATIERLIQSALTKPAGSVHRSHVQSVRFTSLRQESLTPAKAIICMGMQEGSFPRFDSPSSLPLLPIAHCTDEDKYLFLEMIAHAQEMVIMSYVRCHPDDGKEVHPSMLIQELIKTQGSITTFHHPLSSLDPIYYREKEKFQSFSECHYKLLQIKKTSRSYQDSQPLATGLKKMTDLRLLKKLARHPLQFYLEEGLGLRFPWESKDGEFIFPPAEMHRLRTLALSLSTQEIIDLLRQEGKLPTGSFQAVALQSIENELDLYRATIHRMGIDPSSIFSLQLTPYCQKLSSLTSNHSVAPALPLTLASGVTTQLHGVITHLTPEGLLYHGDDSLADLLKIWPYFCLMQAVLGKTTLFLTKKGIVKTIKIDNPHHALERYLGYLQKSLQTPSPLLPSWANRIFKGEDLPKTFDDDILIWAEKRALLPPAQKWAREWRSYLQEVFEGSLHELL